MFRDSDVLGVMQMKALYDAGLADMNLGEDLTKAFTEGLDYGSFDKNDAVGRLMKNRRAILAQFMGGTRFSITEDEEKILAQQLTAAEKSVDELVRQNGGNTVNPETGKAEDAVAYKKD